MNARAARLFSSFLLISALVLGGCGKKPAASSAKPTPVATPAAPAATPIPAVVAVASPTSTPKPAIEANKDAHVIVLCYHQFEEKSRNSLAIKPSDFEAQMEALKTAGIPVIGMQDFLAWRRNEKVIPAKCAVITIDDGFVSGYKVAWPILKKYDYPFTMFVYTDYIKGGPKSGGQSISWEQLGEMRDAGVDVQSHTVSHSDLRLKKAHPADYEQWLDAELGESKRIIENQLGTQVRALAYPYGLNNEVVRAAGLKAGYEALFTVYGQTLGWGAPADTIGRYAIESNKPQIFTNAIRFQGPFSGKGESFTPSVAGSLTDTPPALGQLASASMITEPENGSTISETSPLVRANLATMGELDPNSVEMWISGFGLVPAKYDPATKMISYKIARALQPQSYKVIVSGRVKGKKVETQWNFSYAR